VNQGSNPCLPASFFKSNKWVGRKTANPFYF
jgi:hypothetical protein